MSLENLNEITEKIKIIKAAALELDRKGKEYPALSRNIARILASVKMLELNFQEPGELG